jgi:hypothetical protein
MTYYSVIHGGLVTSTEGFEDGQSLFSNDIKVEMDSAEGHFSRKICADSAGPVVYVISIYKSRSDYRIYGWEIPVLPPGRPIRSAFVAWQI